MAQTATHSSRRPARITIGPTDHGRIISLQELEIAREEPGYVYEIIDGVLNVSPRATPYHDGWVYWGFELLNTYAKQNPKTINFVSQNAEVAVPGRKGVTRPCPDVSAYRNFPRTVLKDWTKISPMVVLEVVSPRHAMKDIIRNRNLYWAVRSIAEYWIIDPREEPEEPVFYALVRRPRAKTWVEHIIPWGATYKARALPGLKFKFTN